ncbi:hypothetical protein AAFF_G00128010 [Aldrovandia affinis]|uniref:USP domain-containing protein n=1 Tax=Aldrovandia affinis TaxID=143900 RepID=A0AAD7T1G3_9TELE|nr:hypothetical protein AAFF_G00128010 [Aldrovandia affinis]
MVMFSTWHRTVLDPRIRRDLPMNGESTDFGVHAPDLAGYLGKVNERAALVENCPWCASKGHIYALRSYRINFHESITLCTNPECLFPLVTKPLEDILKSITTGDIKDSGKRKSPCRPYGEPPVPFSKRHKAEELDGATGLLGSVNLSHCRVSQQTVSLDGNGDCTEAVTHLQGEGSSCHTDLVQSVLACRTGADLGHSPVSEQDRSLGVEDDGSLVGDFPGSHNELEPSDPIKDSDEAGILKAGQERSLAEGQEARLIEEQDMSPSEEQDVSPSEEQDDVSPSEEQDVSPAEGQVVSPSEGQDVSPSEGQDLRPTEQLKKRPTEEQEVRPMAELEGGTTELIAAPSHMFWRNENNLCWLDTMLVALVHCWTLRKHVAFLHEDKSPIQRLCEGYNKACDLVKAKEQMDHEDEMVKVPSVVLNQAERELEDLRMSAFKLIQPKLQCKLGGKETPVFALPLLLRLDLHAENLFEHAFHWDFECAACGHTFSNRCEKTLTTFTHIVPDWHPLHAVHQAQCSRCHHKLQQRKMVLERVSPVFALHFVEGLPQNEITAYSFDFQGNHHIVSTVIQYDQHLKHFVTWVLDATGSWLEFDDLKYPQCVSHKSLPVPANQIHVVFWEVQVVRREAARAAGCVWSDPPAETEDGDTDTQQHNLSLPFPQDDTFIMNALTEEDADGGVSKMSQRCLDTSIGSTTLLDTFEGLSHSDIVTLTLVEVKADTEVRPQDGSRSPDSMPPIAMEAGLVSSTAADSKACSPPKPQEKPRVTRRPNLREGKVAPSDEDLVLPSVVAPPAPDPSSPVTKVPGSAALSNTRWSTLLSRHPSFQSTSVIQKCDSVAPPPRPMLTLADCEALPAKAAEMFGGFRPRQVATLHNGSSNGSHSPSVDSRMKDAVFKLPWVKSPNPKPSALNSPKQPSRTVEPTLIQRGDTTTLKSQPSPQPSLTKTSSLRHKLMKKLQKKKEMLTHLNQMLGKGTADALQRPDSTEITSPQIVSSSTSLCSSPGNEQFFTELLSPATTTSNLSPDSTGLLEMLVTGQEAVEVAGENPSAVQLGGIGSVVPQSLGNDLVSTKDDFLEEFVSGTELQPCHTENVDFSMFDIFF